LLSIEEFHLPFGGTFELEAVRVASFELVLPFLEQAQRG